MTALPPDEVEELWRAMRHLALERVAVLERALVAAREQVLDPTLLDAARRAAHNLAGSLGSFRRHTGSRAATDAERALADPLDLALLADSVERLTAAVAAAPDT